MAFAYAVNYRYHIGGTEVVGGTYTNVSSGTGGVINTGLNTVGSIQLTPSSADSPYYTTTIPSAPVNGAITIVTGSTLGGSWEAKG
jgi:hypothetical protein